jgi:hypothetical protein
MACKTVGEGREVRVMAYKIVEEGREAGSWRTRLLDRGERPKGPSPRAKLSRSPVAEFFIIGERFV